METLEQFKVKITQKTPKIHKITGSLGVYDAYRYYRKNKPKGKDYILTESQFFHIVRSINNMLYNLFLEEGSLSFGENMGKIDIREYPITIKMSNGKVKTNMAIDWDRTIKLWYEDPEAYSNKTLIRHETNRMCSIHYDKNSASYPNSSFFYFKPNTLFKRSLKNKIKYNTIPIRTFKQIN